MSTTFRQPGHTRSFTNSTGGTLSPGALVQTRSGATGEVGVVVDTILDTETGLVYVSGVHEVAKASGAIAAHGKTYLDNSTHNLKTTSTGNTPAGTAVAAATTSATTVSVLINDRPGSALSD